ncbi:MAG: DUF4190 domain-containing protein [Lachnospiraceae bacterium]|nr:DUF4190 domain-containing protein [Lachnospiraceae bacterium]
MDNEFKEFDNQNKNDVNDGNNQNSQIQNYSNAQNQDYNSYQNQNYNNYQNNGYNNMNGTSGQQNYYGNEPATETPSGMAIAGLVLGILSMVCCCIWYVSAILAILALVFSIITVVKNKPGKGMAIAGIVCGAIGLVMAIVVVIGVIGYTRTMSPKDLQNMINNIESME